MIIRSPEPEVKIIKSSSFRTTHTKRLANSQVFSEPMKDGYFIYD
jgi:hypothetical protein